ncbi:hypothetical protein ACIA8O_25415 [Kitasatospora sp. NPDC051853]|uniref:hypothetical protein n=1 Tax=Kitasatospora sp. NPDC051853 TaxID=3364058 RepID=UPI0037926936
MPYQLRRGRSAPALLLALGAAAGCTPPLGHAVGLVREAGAISVVAVPCPEGRVTGVNLHELESPEHRRWTTRPAPGADPADRVPLFAAPADWITDDDALTTLLPDRVYALSVGHTGGDAKESLITFRLADVEQLPPGQVLTWKKGGGTRVVSAGAFRTAALHDC